VERVPVPRMTFTSRQAKVFVPAIRSEQGGEGREEGRSHRPQRPYPTAPAPCLRY